MADQYVLGDRVFAKMKGYPPWPAKIVERVLGKEEKYRILFYGTHDEAIVKVDQMYRYNEETKVKYGKPQRKAQFKEAMEQIEADLNGSEESTSALKNEEEEVKEEPEGELMIDEGPPSLPPVLVREGIKAESTDSGKSKRPKAVSKRDSVSSGSGAPALAPVTPEPSQGSGTEIVSRSGRKIKPKRFADEEITTTKATPKSTKAAANTSASNETGPPAKKTKRASKSTGNKIDVTPQPEESPSKNRTAKTKPATNGASKQISRLSPDISSPIVARSGGPPSLKAAPVKRTGSGNKPLPALVAAGAVAKGARKSERRTRSQSTEVADDSVDEPSFPSLDADDKENTEESPAIKMDEDNESDEVGAPITQTRSTARTQQGEKKVRVAGKNGLQYELSYKQETPALATPEEKANWEVILAENVDKLKEDLEKNDTDCQDIVIGTADEIKELSSEEIKAREVTNAQIRLLRLEGEVIEIIGEIVGCLNQTSADCDRAIELLERLEGHTLNALMMKKHPEVVNTVKKLQSYVGNCENWNLSEEQKEDFEEKACIIREKAVEVYRHIRELFDIGPAESFSTVYHEEVEMFKKHVKGLKLGKILGLTSIDENGLYEGYDMVPMPAAVDIEMN